MAITNTVLNTTATTIYQSVGNTAITSAYLCNTTAGITSFSLYLVPNGQVASNNNIVYYNVELAPTDTYVMDVEKIILSNGDTIQANTTVNLSVTTTVSHVGF
jgi:hypothetical protein